MRLGLTLMAMMLPLAGCVVPPPPAAAYPSPPPAAAPYPPPSGEFMYPGYAYNNGAPTLIVGGLPMPLIFFGGTWGYWDRYHHWHRAPEPVWRHLEALHPGGFGPRPHGGGLYGHAGGPWLGRGGRQAGGGAYHPGYRGGHARGHGQAR